LALILDSAGASRFSFPPRKCHSIASGRTHRAYRQARAAGRHQQGAVVGLRQTRQRFTPIVVPQIMGTIADRFGVSASFLIIGGVMLLLCTSVALIIRRIGRRGSLDESLTGATD
jgi:hypothetical protein